MHIRWIVGFPKCVRTHHVNTMFFSICDYIIQFAWPLCGMASYIVTCWFALLGSIKAEGLRSSFLSALSLSHRWSHLILADRAAIKSFKSINIYTCICRGYPPNQEFLIRAHSCQLHIYLPPQTVWNPSQLKMIYLYSINPVLLTATTATQVATFRVKRCGFCNLYLRQDLEWNQAHPRISAARDSVFGIPSTTQKRWCGERTCRLHLPVQPMECGRAVCSRLYRYIL